MEVEPLYEELEGEEMYMEVEENRSDAWSGYLDLVARDSEDEGVWMEGDAGFSWEDTRMELWRWEAEQGMGEDEDEDDEGEDDKDQDDNKDHPGLLPAEEEEEEWD